MSIEYKVLGRPGRDNALFVWVNSGTSLCRILFDCGENIFYRVKQSDVKNIDYLFFSHLHVDHVAGFDYYFRRNFDRPKTNHIWGPEDTSDILQNRLKGFKWNLIGGSQGEFIITDISDKLLSGYKLITAEGFSERHIEPVKPFNTTVVENPDFTVNAAILDHGIPSVGYSVTEKDSLNINKEELEKTGLPPGSWLEKIRDISIKGDNDIEADGKRINIGELRKNLLRVTNGEKLAYLTDFLPEGSSREKALKLMKDADIVICESQYHSDDAELAQKNYHLTAAQAAEMAKEANVKKLILFHVSERYTTNNSYVKLLDEARTIFPETYFPEGWQ